MDGMNSRHEQMEQDFQKKTYAGHIFSFHIQTSKEVLPSRFLCSSLTCNG
jgi:hypothetical protein